MKTLTITIGLLSVLLSAKANEPGSNTQKKRINQIGLLAGFQNRLLLDEQKSALLYTSREYGGGLIYTNTGPKSRYEAAAEFYLGSYDAKHFKDRYIYTNSYNLDGSIDRDSFRISSGILSCNIEFSYGGKFFDKKGFRLYAGPLLREMIILPDNNIGLLSSAGLYARLSATKTILDKHEFGTNLSFPLMAVNTRLPWHNTATDPEDSETRTFFKKGTRVVTVNNFQAVLFDFHYSYRLRKHWAIGLNYRFNWLRIPYHQPMRSVVNTIHLQTTINF